MIITPVADLYQLADKSVVQAVSGKLTKLYPIKRGEGEHGPYSFQNGELEDSTSHIKVVFTNRDEVPKNWQGQVLYIQSSAGNKGPRGVQTKDNEYKGKVERIISVYETALIEFADGGTMQQPAQQALQPQPPPPRTAPPPPRTTPAAPQPAPRASAPVQPAQAAPAPQRPPVGQIQLHGAMVGAAMNKAIDYMIATKQDILETPDARKKLWAYASSIIRIHQHLESGMLAPVERPPQPPATPESTAQDYPPMAAEQAQGQQSDWDKTTAYDPSIGF